MLKCFHSGMRGMCVIVAADLGMKHSFAVVIFSVYLGYYLGQRLFRIWHHTQGGTKLGSCIFGEQLIGVRQLAGEIPPCKLRCPVLELRNWGGRRARSRQLGACVLAGEDLN